MNMIIRMLLLSIRSRRWPRLKSTDVARTPFRVRLSDLDVQRHMNNGVYLSVMDLGRLDLLRRSGLLEVMQSKQWYPVVVAQTISYRKSLQLFQRFTVETRVAGFDEKAVHVEQRFVRDGEIYARAIVRARFLRMSGGTVPMSEVVAALAEEITLTLPAWVPDWAAATALPPTRAEAPSIWE